MNLIERPDRKVKRRADVVGIFQNEASILRLIGAGPFGQKDDWQTSGRYMMVEALTRIDNEEIDPFLGITTKPPDHDRRPSGKFHQLDGRCPSGDGIQSCDLWPGLRTR